MLSIHHRIILINVIDWVFFTKNCDYKYLRYVHIMKTYNLVTSACLAASNCQPGHHGVSAISNNLHCPGCC